MDEVRTGGTPPARFLAIRETHVRLRFFLTRSDDDTLMSVLNDPDNHLLLERDIRYAFWQNHVIVDAAIGTIIEYGTKDRRSSNGSIRQKLTGHPAEKNCAT